MEEVTLDTLREDAAALAAEVKGLYRRVRWATQQAAALRDNLDRLQSDKEDTSEHE